jgi:hypothetical protein
MSADLGLTPLQIIKLYGIRFKIEVAFKQAVQAMVLDTLSGRTPLYHIKDFMANQDIELLLGTFVKSASGVIIDNAKATILLRAPLLPTATARINCPTSNYRYCRYLGCHNS